MKQGRIIILFSATAFAVTILIFVTDIGKEEHFVGEQSLYILQEVDRTKQIQYFIDQGARNSLYLALQDLREHQTMPDNYLFPSSCPATKGTVVLFSPDSCVLTEEKLHAAFLSRFVHHFSSYLERNSFGVSFPLVNDLYKFTVSREQGAMRLTGKAKRNVLYVGDHITYDLNPSFSEALSPALYTYLDAYTHVANQLPCILEHSWTPLNDCPLSRDFVWKIARGGEHLYLTLGSLRQRQGPVNIAFSFAINLKTATPPSSTSQLFATRGNG